MNQQKEPECKPEYGGHDYRANIRTAQVKQDDKGNLVRLFLKLCRKCPKVSHNWKREYE